MRRLKLILFCLLFTMKGGLFAQFYNGMQMEFGKNRIQYSGYLWSHYKYEQYDVFFYEEGKNLADYVSRSAHLQVKEFETMFEHKLKTKIQFVVYNTQSQSRESNIGNYPDESGNTGGFARTLGNKVFLYFNGDHKDFDIQIRSGIARILLQEVIYGDDYKEVLKNSALISLPDWFFEGLVAYLSEKWSVETEDKIKAYFQSGKFDKFNWLQGQDAVNAGHSIWYYVADNYGENSIANVLYMAKINRSVENGFLFVLGKGLSTLLVDWKEYYQGKMLIDGKGREVLKGDLVLEKPKKNRVYNRLELSSNGKYAAYVTNELSQQKVWLHELESGKKKRILKLGHKLDIVPDYSFPVLTWHPGGEVLTVLYENKGQIHWLNYNVRTGEKEENKIFHFEKILEASYAHHGRKMVFSAVMGGKTDIYVYDLQSRSHEQITDDFYDDRYPVFVNNSKGIVFSSNRQNDTMAIAGDLNLVYAKKSDLFLYNYGAKKVFRYSPQVLRRISNTPFSNETQSRSLGGGRIAYLSDESGIVNLNVAKMDSAIASVDTAVHYRYFSTHRTVTNLAANVLWQSEWKNNKVGVIQRDKDQFKLVISSLDPERNIKLEKTGFRLKSNSQDSTHSVQPIQEVETITVDSIRRKMKENPDYIHTDHYLFADELEKASSDSVISVVKKDNEEKFTPLVISGLPTSDSLATKVKMRNYELIFRTKEVGVQLDNRFLNPQYQRYSGGANYPTPGMNGFTKYGIVDLMEDYSVIGGMRIGDFYSSEVFLSFLDKKKRLDKQYLFYRGTHLDLALENFNRNVTYEGIYRLTFPFTMVDRISATFSLRYDQFLPLAVDEDFLNQDVTHEYWPNVRLDYTYDNTRSLGVNLFSGVRLKVFTEYYQQAPEWDQQMLTFGADVRDYIKIHKGLIWANRIAGGSSLGSQRLMYFMGGVDSWLSQKFNQELAPGNLPGGAQYGFQTIATNLRGFQQNVRNGNSFVVVNSELRWPVVKYFVKRPLSSSFLNNFQIVGFGDVGTAWTGISPFSEENSLNEKDITIGGTANTGQIHLKMTSQTPSGPRTDLSEILLFFL